MIDADVAKVDTNTKSDAPDASDSSKIDVKIEIIKLCDVGISLS